MPLLDGSDPLSDEELPGEDIAALSEPEAEDPGKLVAVVPEGKPQSRRAKAEAERTQELKELRGTIDELRNGRTQSDQMLAEMRGMLQANLQRPVVIQQPQQEQRSYGDPSEVEKLQREAIEALDRKDFTTYQKKTISAAALTAKQEMAVEFQRERANAPQQQQGQGAIPQGLIPLFAAHPEVAAHPNAVTLLQAKAIEAEARGVPPGAQRSQWVFSEVAAMIKGANGKGNGGYDQRTRGALSGVPTTMGGNSMAGSGQTGVLLSADERAIAKLGGMTEAEMARDISIHHPERIQR